MNKVEYERRIAELLPIEHHQHLKNSNPLRYLKERVKVFKEDIKAIYWYSFYFLNNFDNLKMSEGREYKYSSCLFQEKYIKLARMEYYFRILSFIDSKKKQLMKYGESTHYIEDIVYLFVSKIFGLMFSQKIYLFQYERERIFEIRHKTLQIQDSILAYKKHLVTIFLFIFCKINSKITCSFLMKEIYSFLDKEMNNRKKLK